MTRQRLLLTGAPVIAAAALLFAGGSGYTQHGGHGGGGHAGGGGGHGGGGGGWHGGGGGGAWHGGVGGVHPAHAGGFSGFNGARTANFGHSVGGWNGANRGWSGNSWGNRGWWGNGWGNRGWWGNGWGWGNRSWWGWPGYAWWGLGSYLPWYSSPWYGSYASNAYPYDYGYSAGYYTPTDSIADVPQQPQSQQPTAAELNVAHIRVLVPADAKVWFNGTPTPQTGAMRVLTSPLLDPCRGYTFDIRAEWPGRDGPVNQTRQITVFAGDAVTVRFQ
jgi:uncharacterized protein (TIGR03000 family)